MEFDLSFLLILSLSLLLPVTHGNPHSILWNSVSSSSASLQRPMRNAPIVSSPVVLRKLAEKDKAVYSVLKAYVDSFGSSLNASQSNCHVEHAQSYVKNYESTTSRFLAKQRTAGNKTTSGAQNVAWNPLATFHLLRRMSTTLRSLVPAIDINSESGNQVLNILSDTTGWPTEDDVRHSASSVLRIQHVYDLATSQIADGILNGVKSGVSLSANDCKIIGSQALNDQHYDLAIEWFEEALNRAKNDKNYLKTDIQALIDDSIAAHNTQFHKNKEWDRRFFTHPVARSGNRTRRRISEYARWMNDEQVENTKDLMYWGVCSGENFQAEEDKAKLFCYYETQSNPAWLIGPLKVELLALQPLAVIQYHDILGDEMIQKIKHEASSSLITAHVEGDTRNIAVRSSLHTWIDDNNREDYRNLIRTVRLATGLKVGKRSASENLQVASYSPGAHYSVHFDALGPEVFTHKEYGVDLGDRIATFLFYLSDVDQGGATAFIGAGIAATPVKGSAVLWYNLKRSTEIDGYSLHAACPVIMGEKWIANKWIHSLDQMFQPDFQCLQDEEALVGIRINGRDITEFY